MAIRTLLVLLAALLVSGCSGIRDVSAPGQLYSNVIRPRSTDFRDTPVGSKSCALAEHQIKEPVSGYGISVEWTTDRILAAARGAGISRISYTEIQTVSYLMGLYRKQRLIIHGD
jgi:hypothetical protein